MSILQYLLWCYAHYLLRELDNLDIGLLFVSKADFS